jgi:hypothetical protein
MLDDLFVPLFPNTPPKEDDACELFCCHLLPALASIQSEIFPFWNERIVVWTSNSCAILSHTASVKLHSVNK